jgi:hypothetical protein
MTQQPHYSVAYALAAQRRSEFEAASRHGALLRAIKLARRESRSTERDQAARARIPQQRGTAKCAADIG